MQSGQARLAVLALAISSLLGLAGCSGSSTSAANSETPTQTSSASHTVTIYPGSASASVNQTVNFTAYLPGSPTATFTWSVSGGGSINSSTGVYTAPSSIPSSAVTVTATASGSSGIGTATINIVAAQAVTVSPAALAIKAGATQVFTASTSGVTWQVNGTTGGDSAHGTISSNGTYNAPPVPPPGGSTIISAFSAAGSGSATVTIVFSDSSLNGPYAYSYTGNTSSGYLAVAGSFTAQGSSLTSQTGTISNGLENVVSPGSSSQDAFTGTFNVNPDGSATATLSNGAVLQLALVSNAFGTPIQQASLVRFDSHAAGSGTINLQNQSFLSPAGFSGNYVFGLSGTDSAGKPITMAGRVFSDGVGTIPANSTEEDINYNSLNTYSTADLSLQGSFVLDPVHGGTNGNGTLTLTTNDSTIFGTTTVGTVSSQTQFILEFFIVDNTHIKVVEADKNFTLSGDFYSAASTPAIGLFTPANAIKPGRYAFTMGGESTIGAFAIGGVLNTTGSTGTTGTLSSGEIDINNGAFNVLSDVTLTGSSYTVDVNLGRVSFPLTVKGQMFDCVLYEAAYNDQNGQPVSFYEMMEADLNVASGLLFPQSSQSPLNGNYSFNLAGVPNAGSTSVKQDFVGQLATTTASSFQGTVNFNNGGSLSANALLNSTNSTIFAADANGRGTLTISTAPATAPLAYYLTSNGALLIETDLVRVATGSLSKQF